MHVRPLRVMVARAAVAWALASGWSAAAERRDYAADLAAFLGEVDRTYPFFDLKGIRGDWAAAKRELAEQVKSCRSDGEFLGLVVEAIRCLRDSHMRVRSDKAKLPAPPPQYCPGISFLPATESRVVVMHRPRGREQTLRTGTVVTQIDGKDARRVLEARAKQAWEAGGFFPSPQRARLFEYRLPLRGAKGEKHRVTFVTGEGSRTIELAADTEARGWPHTYHMPAGLTRVGRSFYHAKLPSGTGYMYIRRVDGSTEKGMAQAVAAHDDAKGWIIDLRGNGGGGYGASLFEQIKALPRPVAVLIDAGCMSAGETLAREFRRFAGARLFGSRTAGSSSAKRVWAFPSGIATVVLPTRSRWRGDRKPIEFHGIEPDVEVEAVPEELLRGLNSAILRAEEWLAATRRDAGGSRQR